MGHPCIDDIPGNPGVQVLLPAVLLSSSTAQDRAQAAVRLGFKPDDHKAHRFSHPSDEGDVPGGAILHAQRPFAVGDHPLDAAQIHQEIPVVGADANPPALQDPLLCHGLLQAADGGTIPLIDRPADFPALRFVTVHLSHSSCVIVPAAENSRCFPWLIPCIFSASAGHSPGAKFFLNF